MKSVIILAISLLVVSTPVAGFIDLSDGRVSELTRIQNGDGDNTPFVDLRIERLTVFLPRYNLTFTFFGVSFIRADVRLPHEAWPNRLYDNGTLMWNAYYYNRSLKTYQVFDDGNYNITVDVLDDMDQTTTWIFTLRKETTIEATKLIAAMMAIGFLAASIEVVRRWHRENE